MSVDELRLKGSGELVCFKKKKKKLPRDGNQIANRTKVTLT